MNEAEVEELRGLQGELSAANARLHRLTSNDPRVWTDPVMSAHLQLNSAIRYLDVAIAKEAIRAGAPSATA
jgi:hypothetical protein